MRKNFLGRGNDAFVCKHCSKAVDPLSSGSYRNHCPHCLFSRHVDIIPGDRKESCRGMMHPIDLEYSGKKGWIIVHRCETCKFVRRNISAPDDDIGSLIAIGTKQNIGC